MTIIPDRSGRRVYGTYGQISPTLWLRFESHFRHMRGHLSKGPVQV
jgi:hypothetical protein